MPLSQLTAQFVGTRDRTVLIARLDQKMQTTPTQEIDLALKRMKGDAQ